MKQAQDRNVTVRISDGLDVIPELKKFMTEQPEKYFQITQMLGRIKDFELLSAGKVSQTKKFFKEAHKIINSSGLLENAGEDSEVRIQLSLSKDGFSSSGGRLLNGKASGELLVGLKSVEEGKAIKTW